jgi:hypothetical protein
MSGSMHDAAGRRRVSQGRVRSDALSLQLDDCGQRKCVMSA